MARMSGFREMSTEKPRTAPDLAALRIRREPEKTRGPKGWILGGAVLVVAIGVAASPGAPCGRGPSRP